MGKISIGPFAKIKGAASGEASVSQLIPDVTLFFHEGKQYRRSRCTVIIGGGDLQVSRKTPSEEAS